MLDNFNKCEMCNNKLLTVTEERDLDFNLKEEIDSFKVFKGTHTSIKTLCVECGHYVEAANRFVTIRKRTLDKNEVKNLKAFSHFFGKENSPLT